MAIKYFQVLWRQIFEFGVLHTDPHPGNYLVTHHPHLCMLDFGSVRVFEEPIRRAYLELAAQPARRRRGGHERRASSASATSTPATIRRR